MLRACGALLGPEGRLAFFVIHPAEALSEADYKRALSAGPRAVGTRRRGYREMLATAGFCSIEKVDLTDEYRETLGRLIDEGRQHAQELERLSSLQSFEDRQAEQRKALAAIDEGLLKRSLWVAKRSE